MGVSWYDLEGKAAADEDAPSCLVLPPPRPLLLHVLLPVLKLLLLGDGRGSVVVEAGG